MNRTKVRKTFGILLILLAGTFHGNSAVVITIEQVGDDVNFTAEGTLNLAGLTDLETPDNTGRVGAIAPGLGLIVLGPPSDGSFGDADKYREYSGLVGAPSLYSGTGNSSFTINLTPNPLGLNEVVGVQGNNGSLFVPRGYVSEDPILSRMVFPHTTITAIGLAAGNWTYTWGAGENSDSLVVWVIPEPSACLLTLLGGLAVVLKRHRD